MTDLKESARPTVTSKSGLLARAGVGQPGRVVPPGVALAIVLTGQMMAIIDTNIVNVAVPAMHATLGASGAGLQLIVAGYTIAYAVLLVTGARLGDILGHRRMFLAGVALFTLASLGCGLAPNTGALVALRFIQGVGAATMIPQVLSLIQRTYTSPGPRARAMSLYATIISGGAVLGQVLGGLLVSADLFGSSWRPVFLVNVPVGLAVLAFVLPLVLGQPLGWPAWGWVLLALSVGLFALLGFVEHRVGGRGGQPILPRALFDVPGMVAGLGGLFASMVVFGGWLFGLALALQDGLGESALRAGLTFIPCGVAFALVSMNWRRLPASWQGRLPMVGFLVTAVGLLWTGLLLHAGGNGGDLLYVALAVTGGGMAGAFGALMGRVVSRVPVAIAADASGVVVTVNQLGIVVGIAAFGSLYLNVAGALPSGGGIHAFALASGHAYLWVSATLAGLAVVGAALALTHGRAAVAAVAAR